MAAELAKRVRAQSVTRRVRVRVPVMANSKGYHIPRVYNAVIHAYRVKR